MGAASMIHHAALLVHHCFDSMYRWLLAVAVLLNLFRRASCSESEALGNRASCILDAEHLLICKGFRVFLEAVLFRCVYSRFKDML